MTVWSKLTKICFKCSKSGKWCSTFERNALWAILGFFIGGLTASWMVGLSETTINVMKVITGGILAVSAGVAAQQFRFNRKQAEKANKWNTKQLAITQMHASRKVMKDAISKLHGCLEILERKEPYELHEIHAVFGVKLSDGTFCFHGEHEDEHIKLIPSESNSEDDYKCLDFKKNYNGREMKDTVIDYLSEYEYICSAINNDIFDDETVKSLLRGSIISKYNLFAKYIIHQQEFTENKTYFSEFASVAKRYKSEKED